MSRPDTPFASRPDPVGSIACFLSDDVFAGPGHVIEWRLYGRPGATCR